jgi:hypothetical protein
MSPALSAGSARSAESPIARRPSRTTHAPQREHSIQPRRPSQVSRGRPSPATGLGIAPGRGNVHAADCSRSAQHASVRVAGGKGEGYTNSIFPANTPIQPPRLTSPRTGRITPKNSEVDRRHRLAAVYLSRLPERMRPTNLNLDRGSRFSAGGRRPEGCVIGGAQRACPCAIGHSLGGRRVRRDDWRVQFEPGRAAWAR